MRSSSSASEPTLRKRRATDRVKHVRAGPSQRRPHWLCVAYAFPPINRSGTHRTLGFVRHLDRLGWDATVLTVIPRAEPLDESLVREVPLSTTVLRTSWVNPIERIKTLSPLSERRGIRQPAMASRVPGDRHASELAFLGSIREWFSQLLMTPDARVAWVGPAVRAGLNAIRQRRPDLIYSTSPYMSAHIIALVLSRWTHLPWVADFRDPWRGNPFRSLGFESLERWDSLLEWVVLRSTTHIVCCTPTMTEQLRRRHPFTARKSTTILNGFDRERFDRIIPTRIAPADHFVLTHCGQFYGPRNPTVWFAALRRAVRQAPQLTGKIHIALIGSQQFEGRSLRQWAAQAGISDCVHVLGQKSHSETLSHMVGSDALILAGSAGTGGELQIPNKLYEYLAVRRPIIANCSSASPVVSILNEARAEAVICDPADERGLARAVTQLATDRYVKVADAWNGVDKFDRAHRAKELQEVFQRLSRLRRSARGLVLKSARMSTQAAVPGELTPTGRTLISSNDASA